MKRSLKRALTRFEEAVRAHAFRGAQMPADHPYIEREYEDSKKALEELIEKETK